MQYLSLRPRFSEIFARWPSGWVRLLSGWRDGLSGQYRPEKHYMRGPGPKSRAKRRSAERKPGKA